MKDSQNILRLEEVKKQFNITSQDIDSFSQPKVKHALLTFGKFQHELLNTLFQVLDVNLSAKTQEELTALQKEYWNQFFTQPRNQAYINTQEIEACFYAENKIPLYLYDTLCSLSKNWWVNCFLEKDTKNKEKIATLMKLIDFDRFLVSYFYELNKQATLDDVIDQANIIAEGNYEAEIRPRNKQDKLGIALFKMTETLRDVAKIAEHISQGDFSVKAEVKGSHDKLATAINEMIQRIKALIDSSHKNEWLKTGIAGVVEVMRGLLQPQELGYKLLEYLAQYLDIQLGAFYTVDIEKEFLNLSATYAFNSNDKKRKTIKFGEGLVGQVAISKERLIVDNIPNDYMTIQSTLGETKPHSILLMPLVSEGEIKAVIELGSVNKFSDQAKTLLTAVSESVALAVVATQDRENIKEMLEETQQQAEELQTQSEELKSSNEEMEQKNSELQAQQEELAQTNEELEEQRSLLEEQAETLKAANKKLNHSAQSLMEKTSSLERANQYKSEFLANVSHELRTPLNSIILLSGLLTDDHELNEDQIDSAKTIHTSGKELLELINDILDLSKVEAGKLKVVLNNVSVQDVAQSMQNSFEKLAEKQGLEFDIRVDDTCPEIIETDQFRLQQIIKNFLSNAFKFTKEGKVSLSIDPDKRDKPENIIIKISDTGIGIAKKDQERIFKAFEQLDNSLSKHYPGTGLGLSIAKSLANKLGGNISFSSELNKGSTFKFSLPIQFKEGNVIPSDNLTDSSERKSFEPDQLDDIKIFSATNTKSNQNNKSHRKAPILLVISNDKKLSNSVKERCEKQGFDSIHSTDIEKGLADIDLHHPVGVILAEYLAENFDQAKLDKLKEQCKLLSIPLHIISNNPSMKNTNDKSLRSDQVAFGENELHHILIQIKKQVNSMLFSILLVENLSNNDEESIYSLIEKKGVQTTYIDDIKSATNLLKEYQFNCIIINISLCDTNYNDLFSFLENFNSSMSIPVILYADSNLKQNDRRQLEKMVNTVIIKSEKSQERLEDELRLFLRATKQPHQSSKHHHGIKLRSKDLSGCALLLVDDDISNIKALSKVLEKENPDSIQTAASGKEALTLLETHPEINLVLMDIMMPEMDGLEAIAHIRAKPQWRKLPIIVLTAKAMKGDKEICLEKGATDYLPKPVEPKKLVSLIKIWMGK